MTATRSLRSFLSKLHSLSSPMKFQKKTSNLINLLFILSMSFTGLWSIPAQATPKDDRITYQNYFKKKFSTTRFNDFANGVYILNSTLREHWEAIEEFPPYEKSIDAGEIAFTKSTALQSCFPNAEQGIAQNYPHFSLRTNKVVTLPLAINNCLTKHGKAKLDYKKKQLIHILAYLTYQSRGKRIATKIPNNAAKLAYNKGKNFFYARRGQLHLACAHCHVDNAGKRMRAELLSPSLGHPSHFPVYRSKWGGMGSLHRRFASCNKRVRAKPFEPQSEEYRNLEYFLTYMSNGLTWNGPGVRD